MLFLSVLLLLAAMGALLVALNVVGTSDRTVRRRLEQSRPSQPDESMARRLHLEGPEEAARLVITRGMRARIDQSLMLAGYPEGWTWQKIILIKAVLPVVAMAALFRYSFVDLEPLKTGIGIAVIALAYFLPDLLLHSRATERQQAIERGLPDALDKIVVSIESGASFESAMQRAALTGDGPMSEELTRTLQDMRVGLGRRQAYEGLMDRTRSDDVRRFVRSIIQSESTGVSVAVVVRNQSDEMRMKRKLRAEGKAQQVSVKLLLPLILCVFPVLFVVVLAPGILTALGVT